MLRPRYARRASLLLRLAPRACGASSARASGLLRLAPRACGASSARASGLLLLAALAGAAGCIKTSNQPNLTGQDVHLTVIHTSDLHSRFFPYEFAPGQIDKGLGLMPTNGNMAVVGGISRISTVTQQIRAQSGRVIHIDSGDIFQGAPVFNVFGGEVEMRAMTQLGLTAMALGNHEFDRGAANLVAMKQVWAGFDILAANYIFSDPTDPTQPKLRTIIAPFSIYNVGGLRVGVIGMGNTSSLQGIYEGGNSLGIRPLEPRRVIQDTVRLLRPQVDLLVLTTHLGLEEDESIAQTNGGAGVDQNGDVAIEGVDVIFGGHLHIVLNPPNRIERPDGTSTIVCHSGAFAKYLGQLDLIVHVADSKAAVEKERTSYVKSYTYTLHPIDDHIPNDPKMDDLLEPYQLKMNLQLNLGENFAVVPCPDTAVTCPKVIRNDAGGGDSQLGNLVATAMRLRRRVEADFGLTNSLGIRADFESGPLDLEGMYNVFPFENTITTMFLSGDEIQEMLDFLAARAGERGCRSQAQVSGIWYVADCTHKRSCGPYQNPFDPDPANRRPADRCHPEDPRQDGPFLLGDDCLAHPERCKPVLPFASYRTAVNDYIANGGSGFAVLKRNTTKFNTGISLRDALSDYIRTLPTRCDPSKYQGLVGPTDPNTGRPAWDYTKLPCIIPEGDDPALGRHDNRIQMLSP